MPLLFDQEALDRALTAIIPPGEDNALVLDVTLDGAKVALHMEKVTEHGRWKVGGVYGHSWDGDDSLMGQVVYSWKG